MKIISSFLLACQNVELGTYEELLQHLIHVHKICRKFYEATNATQFAQPPPIPTADPKVIDLDGPEVIDLDADEEEAVNVTAPEAIAEVVEIIDPEVSLYKDYYIPYARHYKPRFVYFLKFIYVL